MDPQPHILVVTFPAQGHINPALQFAKRLVRAGAHVTFATSLSAHRRMLNPPSHPSLSYAGFSDGYDQGFKPTDNIAHFMSQLKSVGSRTLSELARSLLLQGHHIACIVYNFLLPWAADVARDVGIPSVLLWVQPASVLSVYYHYFNGYNSVIDSLSKDPSSSIELPGLPLLSLQDLPSFLQPSNLYSFAIPNFRELFQSLRREAQTQTRLRVLVNTYDALEPDAIRAVDSMDMISIGPLIPSAFLDKTDTSDTAFGGDLFKKDTDCVEWLDAKPLRSVIYVSFGSMSVLQRPQMEEIAKGLVECGRPFLWVIRPAAETGTKTDSDTKAETGFWDVVGGGVGEEGLIVPWCSQVEVLSHPSVGCFVTHFGWNSTTEGLATGVPMVGFPQWSDQTTNAKMVQDVWKTGVRVKVNEKGVLESGELKRCLEEVMAGEEMRKNAEKWRDLAREAAGGGGSSNKNIRAFVDEMRESKASSDAVAV